MKNIFILVLSISFLGSLQAQYNFEHTHDLKCTEVKSQANTGTCWSFATASFIESELLRQGKSNHNLSEMYVVRNIYKDKARNYILRQGKANFSQGSLSHDLIAAIKVAGVVPEEVYSGLLEGEKAHNHNEMEAGLKGFLDGVLKSKRLSKKWPSALEAIMDSYIGAVPSTFKYNGKEFTPQSLSDNLGIIPDDYVNISSFSHHPFGEKFILEIPDNYSNGSFHNVPIDELVAIIDRAVEKGYSVAWDGDVSEKGFDAKKGIAVLPKAPARKDLFTEPGDEIVVTQELRQENFESYSTTDDHLMHIIGKAKDQSGTVYYIIKNSWGAISPYKGHLYMSEAYLAMKTVAITVHKDMLK